MILINTQKIKDLDPCKDRLENYLKHYENFSGTVRDFVNLEHLSAFDKRWVLVRIFTKEQCVRWAALCAQSVLHIYEKKYPKDKRPRTLVELLISGSYNKDQLDAAAASAVAAVYAAAAAAAAADAADAAAYSAAAAAADFNREKQNKKNFELAAQVAEECL